MTSPAALTRVKQYLDSLNEPAQLSRLHTLLDQLRITRRELAPHVAFRDEAYARNLVAKSPWFEMVCVCWKTGQATPIHDHTGSSCAFLVVEGAAVETQYARTETGLLGESSGPFIRDAGYICASSENDIHEVRNDADADLITLHIYSPALASLNIYDPQTRKPATWAPDVVEAS